MNIAIIGGGIGGLTTAIALRQLGFKPQIFEQAPELLEIGAAIAIWPNAMRVLQQLGLGETIIEQAGPINTITWADSEGRTLNHARLPIKDVPAVALHRGRLQKILINALPNDSIHLGRGAQTYSDNGDRIRVNFADGTNEIFDVLIGADGIHSRMRALLLADGPPISRGYMVWRGISEHKPVELPSDSAIEIQGRGKRFGIGPVGFGRFGWWASANETETKGVFPENQDHEQLRKMFAGWCAPVIKIVDATSPESILRTDTCDRPSTRTWCSGRMILLGDAIHPTTPNLGQGGCMAVEDAAVLARCFAECTDVPTALRRYVRLRYPRTKAVARYSRLYGSVGQWGNPVGVLVRRWIISSLPEAIISRLLKTIFEYDAYAIAI